MISLDGYTLCYDGSIIIDPSSLFKFASIVDLNKVKLTEFTPDVRKYNSMVDRESRLTLWDPEAKIDLAPIEWTFDSQVKNMSDNQIFELICTKLAEIVKEKDSDYTIKAKKRVIDEWRLFMSHGLINLLRALMSTINTLTFNNVCWGPGRGSSTSSYILFLIGLHDVDCIEYDVSVYDFIRG